MNWIDKSDKNTPFYVTESDALIDEVSLSAVFGSLLEFIGGHLSSGSWVRGFDTVLLEVNCDTGRISLALSSEGYLANKRLGGCSVRLQKLQDFWYDLYESGVNAAEFSERVREEVHRIGRLFCAVLAGRKTEFMRHNSSGSLTLMVYGSEPGIIALKVNMNL